MLKLITVIGSAVLTIFLLTGCMESLSEQGKADPNSIFHKTTQDIEEYDPKKQQEVSDSKLKLSGDPLFYGLEAYGPAMEQVSKLGVQVHVATFYALEGRYPTYKEFMTRIVKANNLQFPVLPAGWKLAYDVANHELKPIRDPGVDRPQIGPSKSESAKNDTQSESAKKETQPPRSLGKPAQKEDGTDQEEKKQPSADGR